MRDTLRDAVSVKKFKDNLEESKANSDQSREPTVFPFIAFSISILSTILFIFLAVIVYSTAINRKDDLQGIFAMGWTNAILLLGLGIIMSFSIAYLVKQNSLPSFKKDKSKKNKKIKKCLKWICICIMGLLVLALIIHFSPILPSKISKIKVNRLSDGMLGFWGGIIGSAIGIFGAYLVMNYQMKTEKKHEQQMKSPILSLGSISYKDLNVQSYKSGTYYIDKIEKWSLKTPVINAGTTPILNVEMTYSFSESKLNKLSKLSDSGKKKIWITKGKKSILRFSDESKAYELISFDHFSSFQSFPQIDRVPVIMPGKTELMNLPSSFSQLIMFYVRQTNERKKSKISDVPVPSIQLKFKYKDYLSEIHEKEFEIQFFHDLYYTDQKNINFTLVPIE